MSLVFLVLVNNLLGEFVIVNAKNEKDRRKSKSVILRIKYVSGIQLQIFCFYHSFQFSLLLSFFPLHLVFSYTGILRSEFHLVAIIVIRSGLGTRSRRFLWPVSSWCSFHRFQSVLFRYPLSLEGDIFFRWSSIINCSRKHHLFAILLSSAVRHTSRSKIHSFVRLKEDWKGGSETFIVKRCLQCKAPGKRIKLLLWTNLLLLSALGIPRLPCALFLFNDKACGYVFFYICSRFFNFFNTVYVSHNFSKCFTNILNK